MPNSIKLIAAFFLCTLSASAQVTVGGNVVVGGNSVLSGTTSGGGGTSITAHFGGTAESHTDTGNALTIFGSPFTTPSSLTSPSWGNMGVWIGNPQAANWGIALYKDSSSTGAPGTLSLVCSTFSNSTPSSGFNTLTPSGCGTPLTSTRYWVAQITASSTQQEGTAGFGTSCGLGSDITESIFTNSPLGSFTSNGSWPSTLGANSDATNGCYAAYIDLTYTSSLAYNVISMNVANCDVVQGSSCISTFPAFGSGHSLIVANTWDTNTTGISTITDSASDTITSRGTCSSSIIAGSGRGECILSADRATAGTNSVTMVWTPTSGGQSQKDTIIVLEVAGTAASSSFDAACYDTVQEGTPFSGCSITTAQSVEFLVGLVQHVGSSGIGTITFTFDSPWANAYQSDGPGATPTLTIGLATQITSASGSHNLSGTTSAGGTNMQTATGSFK